MKAPTVQEIQSIVVRGQTYLGKPFCTYPGEGVNTAIHDPENKTYSNWYIWAPDRICLACGMTGKWVVPFESLEIARQKKYIAVAGYVGQPELPAESIQDAMVEKVVAKVEKARKERKKTGFDRIEAARLYSEAQKRSKAPEPVAEVKPEPVEEVNPFLVAIRRALDSGAMIERTSAAYWVYAGPTDKELHAALKQAAFAFAPKRAGWYKAAPTDCKRHDIRTLEEVK